MEGSGNFYKYPNPSEWDDFVDLDPLAWPNKEERHYSIVLTTCFSCDSACGLLAYIVLGCGGVRGFVGCGYCVGCCGRSWGLGGGVVWWFCGVGGVV
jgi:hypothetical protein